MSFRKIINGSAVNKGDTTSADVSTIVDATIAQLVDSAPSTLDTLNELAAALNDDANFATTVTNSIAGKQDIVSGVSSTEIGYLDGVTSSIQTQLNAKANLSGATFTGEVRANGLVATRVNTAEEGGQIDLRKSSDDSIAWSIDVFGNTSTPDLRFIQNGTTNVASFNSSGQLTATPAPATAATAASRVGYMGIPASGAGASGAYTLVEADAGELVYTTSSRTVTIPANASVPFQIGTTIVFISGAGATTTIAINSDTLLLAGQGTSGSRTLAAHGMATAVKVAATTWYISGNGLT